MKDKICADYLVNGYTDHDAGKHYLILWDSVLSGPARVRIALNSTTTRVADTVMGSDRWPTFVIQQGWPPEPE